MAPTLTPDDRHLIVRERLWRTANPALMLEKRQQLVNRLMQVRRTVRQALRASDETALREARAQVDAAMVALGKRGPVWWAAGAPDYNRYLAKNTPHVAASENGNAVRKSPQTAR